MSANKLKLGNREDTSETDSNYNTNKNMVPFYYNSKNVQGK